MALLLAGLPDTVPGLTVNRLCASGLNAVGAAAQAIKAGEIDLAIAGGVESMTRAPFVMGKATEAFSRTNETFDTTIGWRFINPLMKAQYGVDQMPETGENVAEEFQVARKDQDAFAHRSQQRAGKAMASGYFADEIVAVEAPGGKAGPIVVDKDEHPRPETTLEALAKLKTPFRTPGTVTAGNASGVNDGAAAMIIASEEAARRHGLTPRARSSRDGIGGGPAAHHGHRPGAVDPEADGPPRSPDRRLRRDRVERGVRVAGARLSAPAWRCRTTPNTSIRMAVRSRSVIRSACRARGWRSPRRTSSTVIKGAGRSPPCASAWGRVFRSPWSGSRCAAQPAVPTRRSSR